MITDATQATMAIGNLIGHDRPASTKFAIITGLLRRVALRASRHDDNHHAHGKQLNREPHIAE